MIYACYLATIPFFFPTDTHLELLVVPEPAGASRHARQLGFNPPAVFHSSWLEFSQLDNNLTTLERSSVAHHLLSVVLKQTGALVPAVPARHYKAYIHLSMAIYVLSNNLIHPEELYNDDTYSHMFQSLDAIFAAIPQQHLQMLLQSRLASIRAAWEKLLSVAGHAKQPLFFKVLVNVGASNDWFATCNPILRHDSLIFAVSMDLFNVLQILLDVGCRHDAVNSIRYFTGDSRTAITKAFQCGSIRCAKLLLQHCDVNRPLGSLVEKGLPEPSNFDWFLRKRNNVGAFFKQGLEMFLTAGADIDSPVKWYRCSWMRKRFYAPWHSTHKGDWWPSTLDYFFYFHRPLFENFAHWSRAFSSEVTRAGVLSSLENGGKAGLQGYLNTRAKKVKPRYLKEFLELVLAEQFVMKDLQYYNFEKRSIGANLTRVRGLLDFGVRIENVLTYPVNLLDEHVRRIVEDCCEHDFEMLQLLIMKGAIVTGDTLLAAVQEEGILLLEFVASHGVEVAQNGVRALARAASLHNIDAVDFLLHKGVDINAQLSGCHGHHQEVSTLAWAVVKDRPGSEAEDPSQIIRFLIERGAHFRLSTIHQDPVHLLKYILTQIRIPREGY